MVRGEIGLGGLCGVRRRIPGGDPVRMELMVTWRSCRLPKSHLPGAEDPVWLGMAPYFEF
jgi:hypothetical protein